MRYYITDENDNVVGKFDGILVDVADGHTKHEVDNVDKLSKITVDEWVPRYEKR